MVDDILKQILGKLTDMEQRFDRIEAEQKSFRQEVNERFDKVDNRLNDVENVVRMSAADILENQVEEVARHEVQEKKIDLLAAQQNHLAKRISRLEKEKKANE